MNIKLKKRVNQIKKKQNNMLENLHLVMSNIDVRKVEDFRLYINILNQVYFINQAYDDIESFIKTLNNTLKQKKTKNLRKEIKEDNKLKANMEFYQSLIFLQNHLSGSF
jgi:hypothetical protein